MANDCKKNDEFCDYLYEICASVKKQYLIFIPLGIIAHFHISVLDMVFSITIIGILYSLLIIISIINHYFPEWKYIEFQKKNIINFILDLTILFAGVFLSGSSASFLIGLLRNGFSDSILAGYFGIIIFIFFVTFFLFFVLYLLKKNAWPDKKICRYILTAVLTISAFLLIYIFLKKLDEGEEKSRIHSIYMDCKKSEPRQPDSCKKSINKLINNNLKPNP